MKETSKINTIDALVAKDMGDGYIKIVVVIGTKIQELRVRRRVAVGIISSLAEALDGNLHPM
jgi:hypothetical protein